ncbi:uncharacterized protein PGTG_19571 [Puccinia graminis f. sp. tritici CRL 75-36-700-3]|uniref:Uncharacterized protein n=1 Tax=Puccinia graminis f. sp. tritici (strain CRL 75-36-700-3 / race SCCL) TaxID=418459 RepID=E3LBP6_PUCGT|nr:uncharacterized protein PGTG_19571 [Puccinia graminis f. sp. tritici CRL 75-36-700-3]EFP93971.2 hypothetical protein PGTG_19571 [Puccinia graminis f. sp. tritici CRL 75-36-700-3]
MHPAELNRSDVPDAQSVEKASAKSQVPDAGSAEEAPVTVAAPPSKSNEPDVALAPKADEPDAASAPKADEPDVALAPKAADQAIETAAAVEDLFTKFERQAFFGTPRAAAEESASGVPDAAPVGQGVETIAGLFTDAEFEAMAEGLLTEAELDAIIQTLITTGRYRGSLTLEQVEQLKAKFPAIRDSKSHKPDVASVASTPKADQGAGQETAVAADNAAETAVAADDLFTKFEHQAFFSIPGTAAEESASRAPDATPAGQGVEAIAPAEGLLTEASVDEILRTLITTGLFRGRLTLDQLSQVSDKLSAIYGFSGALDMEYTETPDGVVPGNFVLQALLKQWSRGSYESTYYYFPDYIAFRSMQFDVDNTGGEAYS